MQPDTLTINGKKFSSRLLLGTGKFSSSALMGEAIVSSGTQMVTLALKRVDFDNSNDEFNENLLGAIDRSKITLLPNTSGAMNAQEAIRLARMARSMGCGDWLKLEIHPNPRHLMPDGTETLKAAEKLVKEGFVVLPYINADPVLAKKLEEVGCATVMPLGSPIGSSKGIQTKQLIEIIIEESAVPVVVDAGLGLPSHAAEAMEMGADAVLVNTAIAVNSSPVQMARAFKLAVQAGRIAFKVGRPSPLPNWADPSSPLTGFLK